MYSHLQDEQLHPQKKNNEITVDNTMNMNSQCDAAVNMGGKNGESLLGKEWEVTSVRRTTLGRCWLAFCVDSPDEMQMSVMYAASLWHC